MHKKRCTKCNEEKELCFYGKEFNKRCSPGKLRTICKQCTAKRHREYYAKDQSKYRNRSAINRLEKRYGVDIQFVEDMKNNQLRKCKICLIDLDSLSVNKNSVHIDHCHKTNVIRGILCNLCNFMLGSARDNIKILEEAISYLRIHE